jgi:hypothetical protein
LEAMKPFTDRLVRVLLWLVLPLLCAAVVKAQDVRAFLPTSVTPRSMHLFDCIIDGSHRHLIVGSNETGQLPDICASRRREPTHFQETPEEFRSRMIINAAIDAKFGPRQRGCNCREVPLSSLTPRPTTADRLARIEARLDALEKAQPGPCVAIWTDHGVTLGDGIYSRGGCVTPIPTPDPAWPWGALMCDDLLPRNGHNTRPCAEFNTPAPTPQPPGGGTK